MARENKDVNVPLDAGGATIASHPIDRAALLFPHFGQALLCTISRQVPSDHGYVSGLQIQQQHREPPIASPGDSR
jgi:hypothetical protein